MIGGVCKIDQEEGVLDPLLSLEDGNQEKETKISNLDSSTNLKSNSSSSSSSPIRSNNSSPLSLPIDAKKSTNKCHQGLVRNKRCDNATDYKFSISENLNHLTKKKRLIVFIVFVILIFCFNSSAITWNISEKIPVLHHSHVPGMKELELNETSSIALKRSSSAYSSIAFQYNNVSAMNSTISSFFTTTNESTTSAMQLTGMPSILKHIGTKFINLKNLNNINKLKNVSSFDTNKVFTSTTTSTTIITTTTATTTAATTINTSITSAATRAASNTTNLLNNFANITTILPPSSGYLVWSDKCKMPNIDPYSPDVMKYFSREKYQACSMEQPLTSIRFNSTSQKYILVMDEKLKDKFTRFGSQLECCYQAIERTGKGKKADKDTSLTECLSFPKSVQIPPSTDNILVKCKSGKKQTYLNGHPMMPERPEIRERLDAWKANDTKKPISVLMIGIDSISRINLIRAMPKTAQLLYDNEWFELSGYNKMDDNTFPNLMAILTGYNYSHGYETCKPTVVGKLDECPMIWKTFRDLGYVTAYAEDEASISTFNYLKVGFEKPPVDYYLRPFLLQAEKHFPTRKKSGLTFCLGYQHSADYVYDYAIELATRYKNDSFFGLFWGNTFSHNNINDCSSMDEKMVDYLQKFGNRGILNTSVVIFFSDHGMRFGPTRKLLSGHLEERLPFMFIWLPPWLKTLYPELVNGLSVNKNRLTNPYDLHMTLKHILELSGRAENLPKAPDCPNCQTLLKPVPQSRSCQDVAIEDHWCTCIPYQSIYKKSSMIKKIALYAVDYINNYVATFKNGTVSHLCGKIHLHDVIGSYRAILIGDTYPPNLEGYRIVFTTNPGGAMFEATIRRYADTDTMEVTGSISRLNTYASDSKCISDGGAKKYCHCNKHPVSHAAGRVPAG